jgi:hypothetical protein
LRGSFVLRGACCYGGQLVAASVSPAIAAAIAATAIRMLVCMALGTVTSSVIANTDAPNTATPCCPRAPKQKSEQADNDEDSESGFHVGHLEGG